MQTEVTARHSDLSEKDNRALISVFSAYTVDMQSCYVRRGVGGMLMFLSHIVFGWNVWRMCHGPGAVASPLQSLRAEESVA
jgi:cytochrome c oxidase cbb3-type subunit 1